MNPRKILFGALLSVFAGCSLAPVYERPVLPTAETYPGGHGAAAQQAGPTVARPGWRDYFTDEILRECIALALENNRDLRIAIQRVEEARSAYGIRRADQFPNVGAGAAAERSRVPRDLSFTGQPYTSNQYRATLNLSAWELDFWGRVRSLSEAALESFLATAEARRAVEISLVAEVANSYLLERELDELIDIAQATLASRKESYRIMSRRHEVGAGSKLDAVQASTLYSQAQAELAGLERRRELNRNALTLLIGAPVELDSRSLSRVEPGFVRDIPVGLPSDLLLSRPDVIAAEHRLRSAHANIGAARAAFFPRIALTGSVGTASDELSGLFGSGNRVWSFGPSLTVPIFDAGRNRANLDLSEARRNIAVAEYERTIQTAFREVADALADRRWLAEQLVAQQETFAAQKERARLAELRYRSGAAPYLEVLDAERSRFQAEQGLVQARRLLLSSSVNLYAALGGGTHSGEREP